MKKPDVAKVKAFRKVVVAFYRKEGRHNLPWRKTHDPYKILVSEMMLQQTQVDRVVPKYKAFLKRFPTIVSLYEADNAEVLRLWSGLGYNRRALYLKRAAESVVSEFGGKFPKDPVMLETLPGVGPYTARAIATFSFGAPYTFIETNIRAAFIHHFFPRATSVSDKTLVPYIEAALDRDDPREWQYALMDYGSYLKRSVPNPSRKSAHHATQSRFEGSLRQIRGALLRECVGGARYARAALLAPYEKERKPRAEQALESLVRDGFVDVDARGYVKIKR